MLSYLLDLVRRRNTEKQRLLFRFDDGRQERAVDPFKVWRELQNHPTLNLERDLPFVDDGVEPETTNCLAAICQIFGVERFDPISGDGMTDWELLNLLEGLAAYLEALKKNISGGPTSPAVTAAESSTSQAPPSAATSFSAPSG